MKDLEVRKVPFMGTELMAARDNDGQIWAGVRWMCDGIGFSEGQRKRQIANIQEDTVLSKGGSNLILRLRLRLRQKKPCPGATGRGGPKNLQNRPCNLIISDRARKIKENI